MPAPPPPPPPMGSSGPPPIFKPPKNSNDRDALLKSIQKGAKLKKTVTNDKSAPMIGGASKSSTSTRNNSTNNSVSPNISPNNMVSPMKNFGSIQMELKKQLANVNENRNRGPPPPAPNRNVSTLNTPRQPFIHKENKTNGVHVSQLALNSNTNMMVNSSTLHRKAKSNANLSTLQINEDNKNGFQQNKLVVNHGKPNLAPKPPVMNGKPSSLHPRNGKPVSRAHSLKTPRSPSPQSPEDNMACKFGTVRHMSSVIGQSLANASAQNSRSRPALNGRPSAPPPSVPTQPPPPPPAPHHQPPPSQLHHQHHPPPPPKVSAVRHPSHAPPPPPPLATIPQAPSHAPPPPPPPHKTQTSRPPVVPPMSNNLNPPPPPPRHSSMRDAASVTMTISLDEKYKNMFKPSNQFPQPPPYRNVIKIYNCKPGPIINSGYVV